MVYNFSKDIDYHTQRNNKVIPLGSCGTTSMVMALKQAGIDLESPKKNQQPEDYLTELLSGEKAVEQMRHLASWAFDRNGEAVYPPNEVHVMLEWVVNEITQVGVDRFSTSFSIEEICEHLLNHGGVVLSGFFPVDTGDLNHMVNLAGFIYDNEAKIPIDVEKIKSFIIGFLTQIGA